jgi:hypothetical protein
MTFPVVIPVHPKDADIFAECVCSVQERVPECSEIWTISKLPLGDFAWIPESHFPFTLSSVERLLPAGAGECSRWYFQQLLKLWVAQGQPALGPRWLQVDADIVFQRTVRFTDDGGRALFSPYCDPHFHAPYFEHMARLVPGLKPQTSQSLIAHHVLYDRDILGALFREIEDHHKRPWWVAYLTCVDPEWVTRSGAAENELYSQYALWRFPERVRVRPLWFQERKRYAPDPSLDFVSVQSYNRE